MRIRIVKGETMKREKYFRSWKASKAAELRANPTKSEALLWERLNRKQLGVRFRRQHVVKGYIADFYCSMFKLVVELDGFYHHHPAQAHRDAIRDRTLAAAGIKTLRLKSRWMFTQPDRVVATIRQTLWELESEKLEKARKGLSLERPS